MTIESTMFPIEVYNPETISQKPDSIKYVLARNAILAVRPFHFGHLMYPADAIEGLPTVEDDPLIWLDFPKIPATLIGQVWDFFAKVFDKHKAEAMVYLTFHPDNGYRVFVPQQTTDLTGVAADYKLEHITAKHRVVGTIHSHCDFDAFHSGTDKDDAKQTDGMHMTIGHVNTKNPSLAVMVSANKFLWDFKLDDIVEGNIDRTDSPDWWMRYVNDPKNVVTVARTTIAHTKPNTTSKPRALPNYSTPTTGRSSSRKCVDCGKPIGATSHFTRCWACDKAFDERNGLDTCYRCGKDLNGSTGLYCFNCAGSGQINDRESKPMAVKYGGSAEVLITMADFIIRQGLVPVEVEQQEPNFYEIGMTYVAEQLAEIQDTLNVLGISCDPTFTWIGIDNTNQAIAELYDAIYANDNLFTNPTETPEDVDPVDTAETKSTTDPAPF